MHDEENIIIEKSDERERVCSFAVSCRIPLGHVALYLLGEKIGTINFDMVKMKAGQAIKLRACFRRIGSQY